MSRRAALIVFAALAALLSGSGAQAQPRQRLLAEEDPRVRSLRLAEERRDWRTAIHLAKQFRNEDDFEGAIAYRIAQNYLRLGEFDDAAEWLDTAVDDGFSDLLRFEGDPLMDLLRDHGRYDELSRAIAVEREQRFDEFILLAAERDVLIHEPPGLDIDEPASVLLVLHDDGGRPDEAMRAWRDAAEARKMVIVAPAAIRRFGSGFEWRHADESDWVILEALAEVERDRPIDRTRVFVGGFEAGGTAAMRLALQDPDLFAGLVLVTPWWEEKFGDPVLDADSGFPPIFITGGARDPRMDGAVEAGESLRDAGVRVRVRAVPGVGFRLPPEFRSELRNALGWVIRRAG